MLLLAPACWPSAWASGPPRPASSGWPGTRSTRAWLTPCWRSRSTSSAAAGYLDTLCTVIDVGTVLMHPATAFTLTAHTITAAPRRNAGVPAAAVPRGGGPRPRDRAAAASSMPGWTRCRAGQWDDGGNALALVPAAGAVPRAQHRGDRAARGRRGTVIQVPGSELASSRGGPRCMACPVGRDPAVEGAPDAEAQRPPSRSRPRCRARRGQRPRRRLTGGTARAARAGPGARSGLAPRS